MFSVQERSSPDRQLLHAAELTCSSEHTIAKYEDNKLLIRTLYRVFDKHRFEPLSWECDELKHRKIRRYSSATFLLNSKAVYPHGRMGFLLDMDKCFIHAIYERDAGVCRKDIKGHQVCWDKFSHTHVLKQSRKEIDVDSLKYSVTRPGSEVGSIVDLKAKIGKKESSTPLDHNELVIDFSPESIVGIVAAVNNRMELGLYTNEQLLSDIRIFKIKVADELGMEAPIFEYDCLTARLTFINDT